MPSARPPRRGAGASATLADLVTATRPHLARLVLKDFKSYANEHIVPFDERLTCIIGPNGSGKSNIMDAISFALGVRGAEIRAQRLVELIHKPNDETRRRPEASVELVFAHPSQPTRRFSRTITRDSERSHYYIDGEEVSAEEYSRRLESDVGIVASAQNFLVFQNKVQEIADRRPGALTSLFEHISGSKELEQDYNDCKRIRDAMEGASTEAFSRRKTIASEMRQYKEQLDEARRFEQLDGERRSLELQQMMLLLRQADASIASASAALETANDAAETASTNSTALSTAQSDAAAAAALAARAVSAAESAARTAERAEADARPAIVAAQERLKATERDIAAINKSLSSLQREMEAQRARVTAVTTQRDATARALEAHKIEAAAREAEEKKEGGRRRRQQLSESEMAEYNRCRQQLEARVGKDKETLEQLTRQAATKRAELAKAEQNLAAADTQLSQYMAEESSLTARIAKLDELLASLDADLAARRTELTEGDRTRRQLEARLADLRGRLNELNSALIESRVHQREAERSQKLSAAITALREVHGEGVYGRVRDLYRPSQERYAGALAIALASHADAVVVETAQIARECVAYLRRHLVGVATFLPLDSLRPKAINERLRTIDARAHLAIDLVVLNDARFKPVFEFALGETLVCESLASAREICFGRGERVKAVTIDGAMIKRSGIMSAGAQEGAQRAQREADREALRENREAVVAKMDAAQRELAALPDKADVENRVREIQSRIDTAQKSKAALATTLSAATARIKSEEARLSSLNAAVTAARAAVDPLDRQIATVRDTLARAQNEIFAPLYERLGAAARGALDDLLAALPFSGGAGAGAAAAASTLTEEGSMAKLTAHLSKLENQLRADERLLADLTEKCARAADRLGEQQRARDALLQEIAAAEERLARAAEAKAARAKQLSDAKAEAASAAAAAKEAAKAARAAAEEHSRAVRARAAAQAKLDGARARRRALLVQCRTESIELPLSRGSLASLNVDDDESQADSDEIRVNYSRISREYARASDAEAIKAVAERLADIRKELESLSPNMKAAVRAGAVEEQLSSVTEELERARAGAQRARQNFEEVAQKRAARFREAFDAIAANIETVYKELTRSEQFPNGGSASLALENQEEPYLGGVRYQTMPPGKNFRDLESLSGGEKSIAALALLFAIQRYRPAPVFVIDEVDAALDISNVTKLAAYVRAHATADQQFIQITHKSDLYEKADALIGVYRAPGEDHSRVLTLKLDEYAD